MGVTLWTFFEVVKILKKRRDIYKNIKEVGEKVHKVKRSTHAY